jgi:FMN hydrolase / 5-amino-6-(5-phospho-D-ribitylamino)uracil phosphatase
MGQRWVVLDVGETLIDETRIWSVWADELGVSRLTFMAALGAAIARGEDHREVFRILGHPDWRSRYEAVTAAYGGFREDDVYPDAVPAARALADDGYRVAILANQPVSRSAELRALRFDPEVMAMSDEMGVAKPDPAFFTRALALLGEPDPGEVAYVGDRVDNDVLPSAAAGMRAVWIRRGPWGLIGDLPTGARAALVVDTLSELVERIGEAWTA